MVQLLTVCMLYMPAVDSISTLRAAVIAWHTHCASSVELSSWKSKVCRSLIKLSLQDLSGFLLIFCSYMYLRVSAMNETTNIVQTSSLKHLSGFPLLSHFSEGLVLLVRLAMLTGNPEPLVWLCLFSQTFRFCLLSSWLCPARTKRSKECFAYVHR